MMSAEDCAEPGVHSKHNHTAGGRLTDLDDFLGEGASDRGDANQCGGSESMDSIKQRPLEGQVMRKWLLVRLQIAA